MSNEEKINMLKETALNKLKEVASKSIDTIHEPNFAKHAAEIIAKSKSSDTIPIPVDAIYGFYGMGYGAAMADIMLNLGFSEEDVDEVTKFSKRE